jgi:hypothetical protein
MKKTQQELISISSLIIFTLFAVPAWAVVCTGNYIIDNNDTSGDIAVLSDCTEVTGSLTIRYTSLTSISALSNLTSVNGMHIRKLFLSSNTRIDLKIISFLVAHEEIHFCVNRFQQLVLY